MSYTARRAAGRLKEQKRKEEDMKVRFAWMTKDSRIIRRIKERFNIKGMTINREVIGEWNDQEVELMREVEKKGYIHIREEK